MKIKSYALIVLLFTSFSLKIFSQVEEQGNFVPSFSMGIRGTVDVFYGIFGHTKKDVQNVRDIYSPRMSNNVAKIPAWGVGINMCFNHENLHNHPIVADVLCTFDNWYGILGCKLQCDRYHLSSNYYNVFQLYFGYGLELALKLNFFSISDFYQRVHTLDKLSFYRAIPAVRIPVGSRIFLTKNIELFTEFNVAVGACFITTSWLQHAGTTQRVRKNYCYFYTACGLSVGLRIAIL